MPLSQERNLYGRKVIKINFPLLMIIIIMIVPLIAVSFKLLTAHFTCLSYFKAGNAANSFTVYCLHSHEKFNVKMLFRMRLSVSWCRVVTCIPNNR